ncbi:hypothetical protein Ocin01_20123 [Orchesella cincta]|uniref:CUB domain-containing protein n=1 Tax=Orchesella cincta TaxID=48709 RepID=A0A1D2M0R7_ORCCI|nr:hypothetical protein Ocin01_20123 [Orchesella cincta]
MKNFAASPVAALLLLFIAVALASPVVLPVSEQTSEVCGEVLNATEGGIIYKPFETAQPNERCVWVIRSPNATDYSLEMVYMGYSSTSQETNVVATCLMNHLWTNTHEALNRTGTFARASERNKPSCIEPPVCYPFLTGAADNPLDIDYTAKFLIYIIDASKTPRKYQPCHKGFAENPFLNSVTNAPLLLRYSRSAFGNSILKRYLSWYMTERKTTTTNA